MDGLKAPGCFPLQLSTLQEEKGEPGDVLPGLDLFIHHGE